MMQPITAGSPCPPNMWVGVDFDGTLVEYKTGRILNDISNIPPAVPLMVRRVKEWIDAGIDVRIFTSRASDTYPDQRDLAVALIESWCLENLGKTLEVTCVKDALCYQIWDDRAIQVQQDTGRHYSTNTGITYRTAEEWKELESLLQSATEERDDLAQKYHDACNELQALQLRSALPISIDPTDPNPFGPGPLTVPDILMSCAETYAERNPLYGDSYKRHGAIMAAFYDKGLHIEAGDLGAFTRLGLINMLMSKLARYTAQPKGHKDSAHDSVVYNAMLEEVTPQ